MVKVIGVRFRTAGKIYFFSPGQFDIKQGDNVIVETARGVEFGRVVSGVKEVAEEDVIQPLKSVIRIATEQDQKVVNKNKQKEKEFPFNVPLNIPGITAVPDADSDISISVVRTYTPDKSFLIFFRSAADAISFVWSIVVIFESLFLRIGVFPSFRGAKSQTSSLQPMFV